MPDLLLLLGSFGGACTREVVAPAEPLWFDENGNADALATWGKAVDYCFAQVSPNAALGLRVACFAVPAFGGTAKQYGRSTVSSKR